MRSVILAILAPAAIAFTASASAAVIAPQAGVRESGPVTIDVAYRHVRATTVRGPRGGIHHSRTVVAGRRGMHGGMYGRRGVAVRGGGFYGHRRVYATRGVAVRGGGFYGPRRVYATRGVAVRGGGFYGPRRFYATRGIAVRHGGFYGPRRVYATRFTGLAASTAADFTGPAASTRPEASPCAEAGFMDIAASMPAEALQCAGFMGLAASMPAETSMSAVDCGTVAEASFCSLDSHMLLAL